MDKKAFTLVELLGVIVILTLILILAIPSFTNLARNEEDELNELEESIIIDSAKLFIEDKTDQYIKKQDSTYCLPLTLLRDNEYLKNVTSSNIIETKTVKITSKKDFTYELVDNKDCIEKFNPLKPNLHNHSLIPVKFIDGNLQVVDEDSDWYDYENKNWANAVILKSGISKNIGDNLNLETEVQGMFVWIPRYEYKIDTENNVSLNFISTFAHTKDYIIPSAFTFDNQKLSGIWVGKYETTSDITNPTILPNLTSITNQNIKTYFETSQKFNSYLSNGDSHMAKNSEYEAIIYLSKSKGLINETSTTGNITGIYNLNDGKNEYTMSVYNKLVKNSGFIDELETETMAKYFDNYNDSNIPSEGLNNVSENTPWLVKTGLTSFTSKDGSSNSDITFRIIIS